jgi:hypothetical protein
LKCVLTDPTVQARINGLKAQDQQCQALFEVLQTKTAAQRLDLWQAIERLTQKRSKSRTNISLHSSIVLLDQDGLRDVVLVTSDVIPQIECLFADASSDHTNTKATLLAAALERLQTAGVQEVTARVNENDTELIALLQAFGFTD